MNQIALPLSSGWGGGPSRIAVGTANQAAIMALKNPASWPFRTAVLNGPPRCGKSLLARWFADGGTGEVIDDADRAEETAVFHHWNRAQESGTPLLIVAREGWRPSLPDLSSRLGAALHIAIAQPDEALLGELIALHAQRLGLVLGADAITYLVPRCERSWAGVERLVSTIDRLSLERKAPPTLSIWRDALEAIHGAAQPRLL